MSEPEDDPQQVVHRSQVKKYKSAKQIRDRRNHRAGEKKGKIYAAQLRELNIHKPAKKARKRDVEIMTELKAMLRHNWESLIPDADNFKRFSRRQLEFLRRYAINGRKNKLQAMLAAGYTSQRANNLYEMANRNLRVPYAEDLLRAFELEEKAKMGLMVEDVARWFEQIATKAMEAGDFANANRAMENYGKYLGMFIERKEITHKTVASKEELDARIAELQSVLREETPAIAAKLTIN